jgi:hypothetical protein
MASAPPLPTELHKVVIVLNGSARKLKGTTKRKMAAYYKYLKELKALVKKHGARVVSKEIHLKQTHINQRKKKMRKDARAGR